LFSAEGSSYDLRKMPQITICTAVASGVQRSAGSHSSDKG